MRKQAKTMRLIVVLDLERDGQKLPSEQDVINVLAHSTAKEALEEALQCRVDLWVPTPDGIQELLETPSTPKGKMGGGKAESWTAEEILKREG